MKKQVYKVVTVNEEGTKRTSFLASGDNERSYSTEEDTTPVEGSLGLFGFDTEEHARDLMKDQEDCEIWLAEATNVRYDDGKDDEESEYPEGTVFCDSIRLLERIA